MAGTMEQIATKIKSHRSQVLAMELFRG